MSYEILETNELTATVRFRSDIPGNLLLHLSGPTDLHRDGFSDYLMSPSATGSEIILELPADFIGSYRFFPYIGFRLDCGRNHRSWLSVHGGGYLDQQNPATLIRPMGAPASLIELPAAKTNQVWNDALCFNPKNQFQYETLTAAGKPDLKLSYLPYRRKSQASSWQPRHCLVMFDAQFWHQKDIRNPLLDLAIVQEKLAIPLDIVLLDTSDAEVRNWYLRDPDYLQQMVGQQLLPWLRSKSMVSHLDDTIFAGQSLGGLAAVLCGLKGSGRRRVIAQSPSFHLPLTNSQERLEYQYNFPQWLQVKPPNLAGLQVQVQIGSYEGLTKKNTEATVASLQRTRSDTELTFYSGGHDYAWWRHGLINAIETMI